MNYFLLGGDERVMKTKSKMAKLEEKGMRSGLTHVWIVSWKKRKSDTQKTRAALVDFLFQLPRLVHREPTKKITLRNLVKGEKNEVKVPKKEETPSDM